MKLSKTSLLRSGASSLAIALATFAMTGAAQAQDDTVQDDPEDVRVRQDPTADIERSGAGAPPLGASDERS